MTDNPNLRRRILEISPEVLVGSWKSEGVTRLVKSPLPKDAIVVGCEFNLDRHLFRIILQSSEFQEVLEGARIPALDAPPVFETTTRIASAANREGMCR